MVSADQLRFCALRRFSFGDEHALGISTWSVVRTKNRLTQIWSALSDFTSRWIGWRIADQPRCNHGRCIWRRVWSHGGSTSRISPRPGQPAAHGHWRDFCAEHLDHPCDPGNLDWWALWWGDNWRDLQFVFANSNQKISAKVRRNICAADDLRWVDLCRSQFRKRVTPSPYSD